MGNHLVNDRFWDDSFVNELNSEQKLLFLYLITCPLNKYSGLFEISIPMICFHTSLERNIIEKHLKYFEENNKIVYYKGWVNIKNYNKYNKNNPNIEKSVQEQLKLLPEEIKQYFKGEKKENTKPYKRLKEALPKAAITSNNITYNNIISNNIDIIPNLILDKQYHIRIIGLYAFAKRVEFKSKEHQREYIIRNLKAAKYLTSYEEEKIKEVMNYLHNNAEFKWTLESVGKYIDEDLNKLKNNPKVQDLGEI